MQEFDVFGSAIADFYKGDKSSKILVHSKDFPDQIITGKQLFRKVRGLPDLEKEALVHCKGKILDIGAGAGSHALILQEMGLDVTALEISKEACEIMVQRGVQKVENLDIWNFKKDQYDTLLLLMNGLGIAGKLNQLQDFLLHLKTILNTGGAIIAESSDLLYFADEEEERLALNAETYYGEIEYQLEYKGKLGKEFDWLFVDFKTLEKHALLAGLHIELLFEDLEGGYLVKLSEK